MGIRDNQDLSACKRIWLGHEKGINATRLFRRAFSINNLSAVQNGTLRLFADSRYHLWVNGTYLGRGPTFFHPHRRPAETYDITAQLRPGRNVLAILVHSAGIALHNYVPSGCPGLVARLDLQKRNGSCATITTDSAWRATAHTGWRQATPRRGWAIGFVEMFDVRLAPEGWQAIDFKDTTWPSAEEHPPFRANAPGIYQQSSLPRLRFEWVPVRKMLSFRAVHAPAPALRQSDDQAAYATALMTDAWAEAKTIKLKGKLNRKGGGIILEGLNGSEGAAIAFDLGQEYTGAVGFTLITASEGLIDIGWSEVLQAGRPQLLRKENSYADRVLARRGKNVWFPFSFSAGRYLCLILRGFTGRVKIEKIGWLTSEPNLDWQGDFECNDPALVDIWKLCARTVRVGTQEGLLDCPTREQAAYVGDGNPTAAWIGRLTGDYSYWRELIRETFAVQGKDGQIKSVVFSGMRHILLDYSLLGIIGAGDYLRETGDRETIREILPACDKLLTWYRTRCNDEGLFDLPWESLPKSSEWVKNPASAHATLQTPGYNIFIDHPGLGWHNQNEPGIDRRGLNAAMNALRVLALRAAAEMRERCGKGGIETLRWEADRLATLIGQRFWNRRKNAFADGILDGKLLSQLSQQTNTWCVAARAFAPEQNQAVLERILDPNDTQMARSGPYFWHYMFPELVRAGMIKEALAESRRLWSKMLAGGATTAWETFAGDHLDSFCHAWSSAPVDFLLRHVAGIGPLPADALEIELHPHPQLLDQVRAKVITPRGAVTMSWRREGKSSRLKGKLPPGITGLLYLPDGKTTRVSGGWSKKITIQERQRLVPPQPHP